MNEKENAPPPREGKRSSVTAGTIFDRTRTPLTVWFAACWLSVSGKDGVSALHLKRTLEIGSYQTAWAMLHRFRSVDSAHLPSYLDEFVFRFNRRTSRSRGMLFYRVLELAVRHEAVRYHELLKSRRPSTGRGIPPRRRGKPPSLHRPPAARPWREL